MGILGVVSELSWPTGLCTEPEIVSSTLSRLLYSSLEKNGLIREEEKNEIWIILMVLYQTTLLNFLVCNLW